MERLLLLFSDMNYGLVDSLMKEFEQKNSLMIPDNLRQKVNRFCFFLFPFIFKIHFKRYSYSHTAQYCSFYEGLFALGRRVITLLFFYVQ